MQSRISELQFKENLIKHLDRYNSGWIDGDQESGRENENTVDVVNHELKIAIEIKDDGKFIEPTDKHWSEEFDITQINRQLREWIKNASKKFINYEKYKSLVLIRTDKGDWPKELLISAIHGKEDLQKKYGYKSPSSIFIDKDRSTRNVGGLLFYGRTRSYYTKNINPNVSQQRIISCEWAKKIFLDTEEIF